LAKDVSLSFDEIYIHTVDKPDSHGEIRGVSCTGPSITFE